MREKTFRAVAPMAAAWQNRKSVLLFEPTLTNLGYNVLGQAVGGDEFGPLTVHGRQAGLARVVDEGHPCEVNAED